MGKQKVGKFNVAKIKVRKWVSGKWVSGSKHQCGADTVESGKWAFGGVDSGKVVVQWE